MASSSGASIPSPVAALLANQRGWILDQQYGAFVPALRLFERARREATEADDRLTDKEGLHFIGRIRSEMAMTTGHA
jgi:hypothetical protein